MASVSKLDFEEFSSVFQFWCIQLNMIGIDHPADEIGSMADAIDLNELSVSYGGGDVVYSIKPGDDHWVGYHGERGVYEPVAEYGRIIDAIKSISVTLSWEYRQIMGYQSVYEKWSGWLDSGVVRDDRSPVPGYCLAADPSVYVRAEAGADYESHVLVRSLDELNRELASP